jgi:hypothetical protein
MRMRNDVLLFSLLIYQRLGPAYSREKRVARDGT